jgi:hypothetical protein
LLSQLKFGKWNFEAFNEGTMPKNMRHFENTCLKTRKIFRKSEHDKSESLKGMREVSKTEKLNSN